MNNQMAGNEKLFGRDWSLLYEKYFRICTQTLAYGNRKEDGRVSSRFVETRYFQSEEQLASHARRSPKEIC